MYVRLSLRPSVCRSPMLKPRSRLPDDVITNPRWRTAANIKNVILVHLSENDPIIMKFGTLNQIGTVIARSQAVARIADRIPPHSRLSSN